MQLFTIEDVIRDYELQIKKAEKMNSTDNKHYAQKVHIVAWLKLLDSLVKDMNQTEIGDLMLRIWNGINTPELSTLEKEWYQKEKDG